MIAVRIAAAARRFGEILRTHGPGEAVRRVRGLARARTEKNRAAAGARRARIEALALRASSAVPVERRETASATVRVVVHRSDDSARTAATLSALDSLRERTTFSFDTVQSDAEPAAIMAEVSARAHEPLLAYLPAGVVPLAGWIDAAMEAMEAFDADAVVPNFDEGTGVARTCDALSYDGAILRRDLREKLLFVFAPDARVVETRAARPSVTHALQAPCRPIVVLDAHIPMPDRDGGSARMREILAMLRRSGRDVAFAPGDGREIEPYASALRRGGIDVLTERSAIARQIKNAETIWIARPNMATRYLQYTRGANPRARIVYDSVDMHHVRELRRDRLFGINPRIPDRTLECERAAICAADVTVVVSGAERKVVELLGARRIAIIPTMQRAITDPPSFAQRAGLLFVGSFDHSPNVDAALFLVRDIMPKVWEHLHLTLTIAGSNPPPQVRALRSASVEVRGYVEDLAPLLRTARLSLAPLRYGAGLKAKITQAFGYGMPVIGTTVAAEGFDGAAHAAIVIADGVDAFADAIVATYGDETRWNALAQEARAAAELYTPSAVLPAVLDAVGDNAAP